MIQENDLESQRSKSRLVRIKSITKPHGVLPLSSSQWWKGCRDGIYPAPIKLGPKITAWRWLDIEALMEHGLKEEV